MASKKTQDVENAKLKMADVHYGRQITRKCLVALLSHVENRRRKQRIRGEIFSLKTCNKQQFREGSFLCLRFASKRNKMLIIPTDNLRKSQKGNYP